MAGAPQQQQNSDNSLAMLWGILFAFFIIGLFWFFFHDWISACILKLRLIEARLIASVLPRYHPGVITLASLSPEELSFSDLASISSAIGYYLRFPISLILLVFAWLIYASRATLQFRNYYSMQKLVALEKKNWSQIAPVAGLDLVNIPIDEGPWAMALTPFQFAKQNNLLQLERVAASAPLGAMRIGSSYLKAKLKRELTRRVLTVQLGSYWQNIESLPMHTQSLFAVFTARALHDKEAADQLLTQLSQSAHYDHNVQKKDEMLRLNELSTKILLKKYQGHPLVVAVTERHAYVLGVMASMLVLAREGGVLPSADFLWLKPCDRVLWLMLNCVGRKTAYVEVAGPFSHWVTECALGRKLRTPMVDTAVDALETALKEVNLPDGSEKTQ